VEATDLLINREAGDGGGPDCASQYIFTFIQPPTGTVRVAWAPGHDIGDLAAPPNPFAGGAWTYRLDPDAARCAALYQRIHGLQPRGLADENGAFEDWIEFYNPSSVAVNLDGWYLTDNAANLTKWRFPATNLAGGRFLVVFASGQDRRVPGAAVHTSFQLSAAGEYLALVKPDGLTAASEFVDEFPHKCRMCLRFRAIRFAARIRHERRGGLLHCAYSGAVNLGGRLCRAGDRGRAAHANVPLDHEDLVVTAHVLPSFRAVGSVTLRYRIMFGNELTTPMRTMAPTATARPAMGFTAG